MEDRELEIEARAEAEDDVSEPESVVLENNPEAANRRFSFVFVDISKSKDNHVRRLECEYQY